MSTMRSGTRTLAALLAAAVAPAGAASAGGDPPFEQAQLLQSNGSFNDNFGFAVAVSGNTLVAGAPNDLVPLPGGGVKEGSAHVFALTPGGWAKQATFTTTTMSNTTDFGSSVAIDGDTVVVGAATDGRKTSSPFGDGRVTVYVRSGTSWSLEAVLPAPPSQANVPFFGRAVALEGDRLLVGANGSSLDPAFAGGVVYVFERVGSTWSQTATLTRASSQLGDNFGRHVSLSGDTALIGMSRSPLLGPNEVKGVATFFEYSGGVWTEGQELAGPTPLLDTGFGSVLDIDGDTAVFGAEDAASALHGPHEGSAFVYERIATTWVLTATLTGTGIGVTKQEAFGRAVAVEGDRIVVGSPLDTSFVKALAGSVYVFERDGVTWGPPLRLMESEQIASSFFGRDVSLSGDVLSIGTPGNDRQAVQAGAAYVYRWALPPETYCTAGTSASGCTAAISAVGSASASAGSGFSLQVSAVESGKRGLFFWGSNGRKASPWFGGSSFQCVQPPVFRSPLFAEVGTNGNCDAAYTYDLNARWSSKPGQNPGAGALVQAQFWFRDPFNTSSSPTTLSDALEFLVCP